MSVEGSSSSSLSDGGSPSDESSSASEILAGVDAGLCLLWLAVGGSGVLLAGIDGKISKGRGFMLLTDRSPRGGWSRGDQIAREAIGLRRS